MDQLPKLPSSKHQNFVGNTEGSGSDTPTNDCGGYLNVGQTILWPLYHTAHLLAGPLKLLRYEKIF